MGEIISLKSKLAIAKAKREWEPYRAAVAGMDKVMLLQEMGDYLELRTSSTEETPLDDMFKGMILFERVIEVAEMEDLKDTAAFYNDLLKLELREYEKLLDGKESKHLLSDGILCEPSTGD